MTVQLQGLGTWHSCFYAVLQVATYAAIFAACIAALVLASAAAGHNDFLPMQGVHVVQTNRRALRVSILLVACA